MNSFYIVTSNDDIQHHGIKGQKWGIRRYQNEDGSYTTEGKKRRHLGIKENGKIGLISEKTTKEAKKKFLIRQGKKAALAVASIPVSILVSKVSGKFIDKGSDFLMRHSNHKVKDVVSNVKDTFQGSGIFDKLGNELSVDEAIKRGFW